MRWKRKLLVTLPNDRKVLRTTEFKPKSETAQTKQLSERRKRERDGGR